MEERSDKTNGKIEDAKKEYFFVGPYFFIVHFISFFSSFNSFSASIFYFMDLGILLTFIWKSLLSQVIFTSKINKLNNFVEISCKNIYPVILSFTTNFHNQNQLFLTLWNLVVKHISCHVQFWLNLGKLRVTKQTVDH